MNRRTLFAVFVSLSLPAGVARPAPAQEAPPPALPGVFGEVVEVRVINLEVVVTDRDGVRVPGLSATDFRLLVDGEEVPIQYFTEIRGGEAVEPEGERAPGIESVPAVLPGEPVGTSYLVFIDDFFSIARDRKLALDALKKDLGLLGEKDRMAIVAYDGSGVEMLTSWTNSPAALEETIERAKRRDSFGLQRTAELRQCDLDGIFELGELLIEGELVFDAAFNRLNADERFCAARLAEQVARSAGAATATLRGFANPPGRKVMLLFSGGWPFLPAEFVVSDFTRPILIEPGIARGDELLRPLTDTANLLGYTLYPVDVPGLQTQSVDASRSTPLSPSALAARSFLREDETEYTLRFLAEKTGGEAQVDGRRSTAFRAAVADTRSYYWIGFTPAWQGSDRRHDVVVEARDPKLKVRSRSGYLDSSRQREVTMAVESALLFGNPPAANPLAIAFGRPERVKGKMEIPLAVGIPLDSVTVLPSAGQWVAEVELRVAVQDTGGNQAEIPIVPLRLAFDAQPPAGTFARYETKLQMRHERHQVVVAVYDPASGRILSGAGEVSP